MVRKFLSGLLIAVSCMAEPDNPLSSGFTNPMQQSCKQCSVSPEKTGSVTLRAIVIVKDASTCTHVNKENIHGVIIEDHVNVPSSRKEFAQELQKWIGNVEITRKNLLAIKNNIIAYYAKYQQNMIAIEIPEQDITTGVVTFVVTQARVGNITYCGNRWFSKERVQKKLHLQTSKPLDNNQFLNDLAWLNQNPFHSTEAVFKPGEAKGLSDLTLVTRDRLPLRAYTGGDNTGPESTGQSRIYGGLTWGDAFCIDDFLTYQFTSNRSFNRYNAHSMSYISYLPWQHMFQLSGGYARIQPRTPDFESHGKEAQASFRYKIPFKPLYTNFQQELYFGFDYKYITSLLFFVSSISPVEPVQNSIVNVTQEMVGYMFEYKPSCHELIFRLELFGSPTKWLPHQTINDYSSLRKDAKPRYFYGTATLGEIYTFRTKEAISLLLRAQGSPNTLIPSEQFVLGGYNSVRGYEQNVFISDNAICANLEIRSRPFTFFKKMRDELTFLAFLDYGWGYNYHSFSGIQKSATLLGIGPGVRYTINPYLQFRTDYGFKLHHVHFDDQKLGMWHIGGTLSY